MIDIRTMTIDRVKMISGIGENLELELHGLADAYRRCDEHTRCSSLPMKNAGEPATLRLRNFRSNPIHQHSSVQRASEVLAVHFIGRSSVPVFVAAPTQTG